MNVYACDRGAGAFVRHEKGEEDAIVVYSGQRSNDAQSRQCSTMEECCAVVLVIQHSRHFLWGRHLTCITDHAALVYLYAMQDKRNMSTRWGDCTTIIRIHCSTQAGEPSYYFGHSPTTVAFEQ